MPRKRTTRQRRVASKRRSVRVGGSRRNSARRQTSRRRVLRGGTSNLSIVPDEEEISTSVTGDIDTEPPFRPPGSPENTPKRNDTEPAGPAEPTEAEAAIKVEEVTETQESETARKEVESIITEMRTQQTVIDDTAAELGQKPGTSIDKDGYDLDAYSKFMPTVHSKGCLHFCKDIYGSPEITGIMCKRNMAIDRFQELEESFNSKMMEIGSSIDLLSETPLPQRPTLTPGQKQKWCNVCDIPSFMKVGARELNRKAGPVQPYSAAAVAPQQAAQAWLAGKKDTGVL